MGEATLSSDIAIIGLAYEFPQGATTEESFWEMVLEGRSASTEFPPDRMNIDAFYHPDANRPSSVRFTLYPLRNEDTTLTSGNSVRSLFEAATLCRKA